MDPSVVATTESESVRSWGDLPWDALSIVFEKIGPAILVSAQFVCRPWWILSNDPRTWKCININRFSEVPRLLFNRGMVSLAAVNRTDGGLLEFAEEYHATDELLNHIAERNSKLKRLRLVNCDLVTDNGLIEACKSFPLLEFLEITFRGIELPFESVGRSCPNLKIFQFHGFGNLHSLAPCNKAALAIAKNMCGLRELQLFENQLNEEGMHAVLDGCPFLESLDVRHCFQLNFGDELKDRCKGFTSLRLPEDFITDCPNIYNAFFNHLYQDYASR